MPTAEPQSIFIEPVALPEDGPRNVEARLNEELGKAYAMRPAAAAAREPLSLTVYSPLGLPDTAAETLRKLTAMLAALAATSGMLAPALRVDAAWPGGLPPATTIVVNDFLLDLARRPITVSADPNAGSMNFALLESSGLLATILLDDF